jgi:hypothetical protein
VPDFIAQSTRCTALTNKGNFCDYESLPDAPFPICIKHASLLLRYLNSHMPDGVDDRIILAARAFDQAKDQQAERRRYGAEPVGQVYYLQVGKLIKIGYTENLTRRLGEYPPDARVLAVEPGNRATERRRHEQFAEDLEHGYEWFAPSPVLLTHIRRLRAATA